MEKRYLRAEFLGQCDSAPRRCNRSLGEVDRQENSIDVQDVSGIANRITGNRPSVSVAMDRSVAVAGSDQALSLGPAPELKARLVKPGIEIVV